MKSDSDKKILHEIFLFKEHIFTQRKYLSVIRIKIWNDSAPAFHRGHILGSKFVSEYFSCNNIILCSYSNPSVFHGNTVDCFMDLSKYKVEIFLTVNGLSAINTVVLILGHLLGLVKQHNHKVDSSSWRMLLVIHHY